MISHKHKFIFIHIPKCAGSSIKDHFFTDVKLDWKAPNYELLYGWCPKRKIHLQHATTKQLLETELIKEPVWNSYFKFTIVRNPWDRAYSSYLWVMKDRKINGTFEEFMLSEGAFKAVLKNQDTKISRAVQKLRQVDFFNIEGQYKLDFVGRFESLKDDIERINNILQINEPFEKHSKKSLSRASHYSRFYGKEKRELVERFYKDDIENLGYSFENRRNYFMKIKDILNRRS